jgi:hypothetical protein
LFSAFRVAFSSYENVFKRSSVRIGHPFSIPIPQKQQRMLVLQIQFSGEFVSNFNLLAGHIEMGVAYAKMRCVQAEALK